MTSASGGSQGILGATSWTLGSASQNLLRGRKGRGQLGETRHPSHFLMLEENKGKSMDPKATIRSPLWLSRECFEEIAPQMIYLQRVKQRQVPPTRQ